MNHKHLIALVLAALVGGAQAATEADVEKSFNPYKDGFPSFRACLPASR